ncbi:MULTISPECIES: hypothetical protein [Actinomadura]|uniref:Uncharacterized protein n=1 Tax=Actinomadura yumaensis TaxID=111807 RepID=A0ABW2CKB0_9ACTN|nr:hypothetical protein [Actinomadura sp. J1-007]
MAAIEVNGGIILIVSIRALLSVEVLLAVALRTGQAGSNTTADLCRKLHRRF